VLEPPSARFEVIPKAVGVFVPRPAVGTGGSRG